MIRTYESQDKQKIIALLRLNTPCYFADSEEKDFSTYLDNHAQDYFVVEENNEIIGAGGINYFAAAGLARLSWDIIHPAYQGKGMGKELTLFRINEIRKNPTVHLVVVRTTQLVYKFYQKTGFTLERTEKDFWAQGFDLYQMTLELNKITSSSDGIAAGGAGPP